MENYNSDCLIQEIDLLLLRLELMLSTCSVPDEIVCPFKEEFINLQKEFMDLKEKAPKEVITSFSSLEDKKFIIDLSFFKDRLLSFGRPFSFLETLEKISSSLSVNHLNEDSDELYQLEEDLYSLSISDDALKDYLEESFRDVLYEFLKLEIKSGKNEFYDQLSPHSKLLVDQAYLEDIHEKLELLSDKITIDYQSLGFKYSDFSKLYSEANLQLSSVDSHFDIVEKMDAGNNFFSFSNGVQLALISPLNILYSPEKLGDERDLFLTGYTFFWMNKAHVNELCGTPFCFWGKDCTVFGFQGAISLQKQDSSIFTPPFIAFCSSLADCFPEYSFWDYLKKKKDISISFGEHPQKRVSKKEEILLNQVKNDGDKELILTGKSYRSKKIINDGTCFFEHLEYCYDGKKYVYANGHWYLVEPIIWKIDYEHRLLISQYSLFVNAIFEWGCYKTEVFAHSKMESTDSWWNTLSELYDTNIQYFIEDMVPSDIKRIGKKKVIKNTY